MLIMTIANKENQKLMTEPNKLTRLLKSRDDLKKLLVAMPNAAIVSETLQKVEEAIKKIQDSGVIA
jgi:hypothetical protein